MDLDLISGFLSASSQSSEELARIFAQYGDIYEVSLKESYGFVQYDNAQSVVEAIRMEQGRVVAGLKMGAFLAVQPYKFRVLTLSFAIQICPWPKIGVSGGQKPRPRLVTRRVVTVPAVTAVAVAAVPVTAAATELGLNVANDEATIGIVLMNGNVPVAGIGPIAGAAVRIGIATAADRGRQVVSVAGPDTARRDLRCNPFWAVV